MSVIDDPLAEGMLHLPQRLLARSLSHAAPALARNPTLSFLAARTLFFDHEVNTALDQGVTQVVIVGAGYDSRAWRLARPAVRFFEVDHPATQADKRSRAPAGGPAYVACDLEAERVSGALVAAGYEVSGRAVFVVEGLTMYLAEPVVRRVLADLAELSVTGSCRAVNLTVQGGGSILPLSRVAAWAVRATWHLRGEPTHAWVRPDALAELLADAGWRVDDILPAPELAARLLPGTRLRVDGLNPGAICVAARRPSEPGPGIRPSTSPPAELL